MTKVNPVPEGFATITPFLVIDEALDFIRFLNNAFDAKVIYMMKSDDGKVRHSTIRIGDSNIMISSGNPEFSSQNAMLHLYVGDTDALYKKAVEAGANSIREPEDQFYGDRSAGVKDDWGNTWWIATQVEKVSDEEMKRREKVFREEQAS